MKQRSNDKTQNNKSKHMVHDMKRLKKQKKLGNNTPMPLNFDATSIDIVHIIDFEVC